MNNGYNRIPAPYNEPALGYAPGSRERALLKIELDRQYDQSIEIPLIIGGKEIRTGQTVEAVCPHEHRHVLAVVHQAGENEVRMAVEAAMEAKTRWDAFPWEHRAAVFLKMADLIAAKYRFILNAATMLGQSKTAHQAEIEAACEISDFFRFNAHFAEKIYRDQPLSERGTWNRVDYRALEGFVLAVTPFNFTAIGGNLPTAPALMGNTVLWKPASTAVLSNYYLMRLFEEAGLPPGVINFLPGKGSKVGGIALADERLAGLHFTGSVDTFKTLWRTIAENIDVYRTYPRIVGETGGKDFLVMHPSAGVRETAVAIVRAGFEYQGQKCSACSRVYAPRSKWNDLESSLTSMISEIRMGDVRDFTNFMNAVIDEAAFRRIMGYIEKADGASSCKIIAGGRGDKTNGYFVEPTLIVTEDPNFVTMREEIFGPVITCYIYDDEDYERILKLCDRTSPYALTGAVFAKDRHAVLSAEKILRHAAGNFYINDKPSGSIVGQQPFGGSRGSGTNDKAGSFLNLTRWVSARAIKENFAPPKEFKYPYMQES